VLELKLLLQTSKKGGTSCSQFIQQIQSIADRLRSIGSEISDQDLVLYTLQGLGSNFEPFVSVFSMRQATTSMSDLQSLLPTHEARLQVNLSVASMTSAHLTTSRVQNSDNSNTAVFLASGSQPKHSYSTSSKGNSPQIPPYNNIGHRGRGGYRGRGRGQYTPQSGESS
jgi:gag-polypeptide of LTR copia-type